MEAKKEKQETTMSKIRQGVRSSMKNHKASWFASVFAAGAIALFALNPNCNGTREPCVEGPMPVKCGDRYRHETEAYPHQFKEDGTVKVDENNQKVPNKRFCLIDSFDGNNICEREKISGLPTEYLNGTKVPSPLENDESFDCIMQTVRDNPCAARAEDGSNEIARSKRRRITGPLAESIAGHKRQRTPDELKALLADISKIESGDNYYVVTSRYREMCPREAKGRSLEICTPWSLGDCLCPNHEDCAPRDDTCGNKRYEPEEEDCDRSHWKGKRACGEGRRCTSKCTCVDARTCGDGKITPPEQCDPRSKLARRGCDEGSKCTDACTCEVDQTCGNNKVEGTEHCDGTDRSKCSADERCNKACTACEPAPRKREPCESVGSPAAVSIRNNLMGDYGRRVLQSRRAVTANQPDLPVAVKICTTVDVSARGKTSGGKSVISCTGAECAIKSAPGPDYTSLVSGKNIGEQGEDCYWSICKNLTR